MNLNSEKFEIKLLNKVKSIAEGIGYVNYDVTKRQITTKGGNYLSILHEADIDGNTKHGAKKTYIFVKQVKYDSKMTLISMSDVFNQELYVYQELFTIYNRLQEEANIPVDVRFKTIRFYKESDNEMILFDNVSKYQFCTLDRKQVIPLKFGELCIQQLAKFHALSFALERKEPEYFEKTIKTMKHPYKLREEAEAWKKSYRDIAQITVNNLEGDMKERAEKYLADVVDKIAYYQNIKNATNCCFCHGDFMANNVLKKEIYGDIVEVLPIDFQLSHYGCPVLDFAYFMFSVTDRVFRKNNLENLKNMYYDTLHSYLKYFNMDVQFIYPRKNFEKDYKEKLGYGLIMALLQLPPLMTPEEDAEELQRNTGESLNICQQLDARFKCRVQELFDDVHEWGYL